MTKRIASPSRTTPNPTRNLPPILLKKLIRLASAPAELLRTFEIERHLGGGFLARRFELVLLCRVDRRVQKQRMSADRLRGFDRAVGRNDDLDLDGAGDVHLARQLRIDGSALRFHFPPT